MRQIRRILTREPVLVAAAAAAAVDAATVFGLVALTEAQKVALGTLVGALVALWARGRVTPVARRSRKGKR